MRISPIACAMALAALSLPAGVAAQPPASTLAAQPLMKSSCIEAFQRENRKKLHYRANVAWTTYEQHRKSEQVWYDQLRWYLADPNEQDSIPVLEQSAAQQAALLKPTVARQRDKLNADLKRVRHKYLTNGCLPSKDAKEVFKEAMRYYKRAADDIFAAEQRLFAANLAIQTAQADLAGQALTDADLEFATVEENAIRCNELLESLY